MKSIQKDYRIVLASASPRRQELLSRVGLKYELKPSDCEEITDKLLPGDIVEELSRIKAQAVAETISSDNDKVVIIGADTVVALDDKILGKPADEADAFRMLKGLQGRSHSVFTGVTLIFMNNVDTNVVSFYEETKVWMYPMDDEEIWEYIRTGEPMDKAGSYAVQGIFAAYIERIEGDFNNVVGLPIAKVCRVLKHNQL